jgi:hypothetical protein
MNVDVHVRHLFSKDYHEIKIWQERLSQGVSFEELAELAFEDTILTHRGGDLGWCSLWDLDHDFSTEIIGLQEKEISDIVETKWGYHIIQLLDRKKNMLLREEEYLQKKSEIEKLVRRRKERHLANTFIHEFMEKINPQPHQQNFRLFWEALTHGLDERGHLDYEMVLTKSRVEQLKVELNDKLDDPLIQFGKKEVTIIEYLNILQKMPVSERPRFRTARQLSNQIGIWMRDTLLLKEAYRLDVHQNDRVRKELRQFKERQCYLHYLQEEIVKTDVPEEIHRYFHAKNRQKHPVLGKFHTVQEWIFWKAQINLHERLMNLPVEVEIDSSLVKKESKEINWNRRVRLFLIPKPA